MRYRIAQLRVLLTACNTQGIRLRGGHTCKRQRLDVPRVRYTMYLDTLGARVHGEQVVEQRGRNLNLFKIIFAFLQWCDISIEISLFYCKSIFITKNII